eukprot:COSAG01_NODE_45332_length_410_cov_0.993569_1_plen_123_part_10
MTAGPAHLASAYCLPTIDILRGVCFRTHSNRLITVPLAGVPFRQRLTGYDVPFAAVATAEVEPWWELPPPPQTPPLGVLTTTLCPSEAHLICTARGEMVYSAQTGTTCSELAGPEQSQLDQID